MTIQFEGSKAIAATVMADAERRWFGGVAAALAALGALALWVGTGWIVWVGGGLLVVGVFAGVVGLSPDIHIVIDAQARTIVRSRRFPWHATAHTTELPFSAVYSIGVDQILDSETGDRHTAVLRLKGGRNIALWDIRTSKRIGHERTRYLSSDPDLRRLQQLTGFYREDRLS